MNTMVWQRQIAPSPVFLGRAETRYVSILVQVLLKIHMKKPSGKNPHRGSTFESFLAEEGILEDVTTAAVKRVLA